MSDLLKKARRQQQVKLWQVANSLSDESRKAQTENRRRRKKFKFTLNVSSPADRELASLFSILIDQSLLTPYIRNGVALYSSLKDGESLETLFNMFGWVKEVIHPQTDAMLALSSQMKIMERMMESSGHVAVPFTERLSEIRSEDDFDTEPLRIATSKSDSDEDSVSNFLTSFGKV